MNQKDNFTDVVEATSSQLDQSTQSDQSQPINNGQVTSSDGAIVTLGQDSPQAK
jgi:hypothetical protein